MRSALAAAAMAAALMGAPSAQAVIVTYVADLSGAAEAPPNASPGSGSARVDFDDAAHTLRVIVSFQGLIGTTTASHVHCCTLIPGVATVGVATELPLFTGFPTGVTSGTYDHTFDMLLASTWNPAFVSAHGGLPSGAEAAFGTGLAEGRAYLNVHTTFRPGGEIRGFLHVPEPSSLALIALPLLAAGASARRRKAR